MKTYKNKEYSWVWEDAIQRYTTIVSAIDENGLGLQVDTEKEYRLIRVGAARIWKEVLPKPQLPPDLQSDLIQIAELIIQTSERFEKLLDKISDVKDNESRFYKGVGRDENGNFFSIGEKEEVTVISDMRALADSLARNDGH